MAARSDLEIVRALRGTFAPTRRERLLRWTFAVLFLAVALPVSLALAAGGLPPKPGHLPTALMLCLLVPFSLAIGLYALFAPYPVYVFDGTRVACLRGRKTLWEVPVNDLVFAEAGDSRANLTLILRTPDRELAVNLYPPLHAAWKAARKRPPGEVAA